MARLSAGQIHSNKYIHHGCARLGIRVTIVARVKVGWHTNKHTPEEVGEARRTAPGRGAAAVLILGFHLGHCDVGNMKGFSL